jgi:hypothetical protein
MRVCSLPPSIRACREAYHMLRASDIYTQQIELEHGSGENEAGLLDMASIHTNMAQNVYKKRYVLHHP